jgi:cytochrome c peroxidase
MPTIRPRVKRVVSIGALAVALAGVSLVATVLVGPVLATKPLSPTAVAFAERGAHKVRAAYAEWVAEHNTSGGDRNVAISLGYWKALSASYTQASGLAKLNLIDGAVSVTVSGLPTGEWDVWLVDNRPGRGQSVRPESTDAMINVGRLVRSGTTAKLDADLGRAVFKEFHVDLVAVAPAGADPQTGGLLFGSPALFQRLYTALRNPTLLLASDFASRPGIAVERRWASVLSTPAAEADDIGIFVNEDVVFNDLVAKGADLFLNETFNGNGRTCATCHRKEANFTIDVNFIAALPDDDALFVAEFTPALAFNPFGRKFEVPVLMRKHGLIVENVDGMSDLVNKFAMRGTPHTLGMRQSLRPRASEANVAPKERTGWGGDGAPGDGTLRDFATGAVTQHFPKRLNRVPGVDFRLPNDAELDAMQAFQLSLGRQVDLVLPLPLKDSQVVRGQQLFIANAPAGGGCHACHFNAGANASFDPQANRNFNTGVENQVDRPQVLTLEALNLDLTPGVVANRLPRDGGFGQAPGSGPDALGFGDGTFNSVSLIEAADTGPFFHDNSIATIEGAVAFYNSTAFNSSPSGTGVNLQATQVEAIAAFLRVINALDNIREAAESAAAAKSAAGRNPRAADQLLRQAIGDVLDAHGVLFPRALHTKAQKHLESAADNFRRASSGSGSRISIDRSRIDRGLSDLARARGDMI